VNSRLVAGLKIALTLVLLVVVGLSVDLSKAWGTLSAAHLADLLFALALYQLGILVRSWRWQTLLQAQGVRAPLRKLLGLYYVGTFFNSFLPSGFGGDVVRMYELSQQGADGALATSTVLVDRALGLLLLFIMALVALPFSWQLVPASVIRALLALIVGSVLGVWLFLNRRLVGGLSAHIGILRKVLANRKVASFYDSFPRYGALALARASAASLAFNLTLIAAQVYLARAVDVHISLGYFFLFVPILSSLLLLPISVSGLGVREGGYVLLFGQAGVASSQALAMSLLFYALNLATGVVGGVLYILQGAQGYRRARSSRGGGR
jgi:hypothetical protein